MDLEVVQMLHVLATEPELVVPSGKSLLSMLTKSRSEERPQDGTAALHARVEKVIHGAFWDQALEALSDPTPSVQIARLKGLLKDLHDTLSPLFPPNHRTILTLSYPLPPTASPLITTNMILREVLVALRQRAAPVRDAVIDQLILDLDAPISATVTDTKPGDSDTQSPASASLASLTINTFKAILALAENMKSDLNQVVFGSLTESQVKEVVREQATSQERQLTLQLWGGEQKLEELWTEWLEGLADSDQQRHVWIRRLGQSLRSTDALSCPVPGQNQSPAEKLPNELPPQFFFVTTRLVYVQNYIQALVVAASLRSLTRLPPSSGDTIAEEFMNRVWILLKAEVDDVEPDGTGSKVVNFADEVVRVRRLTSAVDEHEEGLLRAAVDRTLQYGDPVFKLLQQRLINALSDRLCQARDDSPGYTANGVPSQLQSGRAQKRPRLEESNGAVRGPRVKGFEEPVLVNAVEEVYSKLSLYTNWVDTVWNEDSS